MTRTLEGKVALVTGSGRGIGRAIALKLASAGARLVINDLDEAPAAEVVETIRRQGGGRCSPRCLPHRHVQLRDRDRRVPEDVANRTAVTGTPASMRSVAHVWRAAWTLRPASSSPAPRMASCQRALSVPGLTCPPARVRKTRSASPTG